MTKRCCQQHVNRQREMRWRACNAAVAVYGLPLVSMKPDNRAKLEKALAAQGLLQGKRYTSLAVISKPANSLICWEQRLKGRVGAESRQHPPYAGRLPGLAHVQFLIDGKLPLATVRAPIVGTPQFHCAQRGYQRLDTQAHVLSRLMGMIEEVYRLPLVPMKPGNRAKLEKALAAQGLLQPQRV